MKKKIALIGSGAFASRVVDIIESTNKFEIIGYFDGYASVGDIINGYKILGNDNDAFIMYGEGLFDCVIICLAYTQFAQKKKLFELYSNKIPFATIIHPTAYVSPKSNIGAGVIVCENATICKGASIENNVTIKPGVLVSHDSKIGKHSFIAARVAIAGLVEIGECCFIGINATIRNRITIGDNVVLGMGSVAFKNLNANSIYVGNPAHYLKANIDYNSSNTE